MKGLKDMWIPTTNTFNFPKVHSVLLRISASNLGTSFLLFGTFVPRVSYFFLIHFEPQASYKSVAYKKRIVSL